MLILPYLSSLPAQIPFLSLLFLLFVPFSIRYGHIETVHHVAHHIATIREIQTESKNKYNVGFTEFVPLSFVAKESPMWKSQQKDDKASNSLESIMLDEENSRGSKGPHIRSGPTGVEVILTHAVSRLMLAGHIDNIQVCRMCRKPL